MGVIGNWRVFYGVMAVAVAVVLTYYVLGTRPLIQREAEVDRRLAETIANLDAHGLGTTTSEIEANIERVHQEIDVLSAISRDADRSIRFEPDVREMLQQSFALLDFDQRRYLVADNLAENAASHGVEVFDGLEEQLPAFRPGMERPYLLWAQLSVIEQLVDTAIRAGVEQVQAMELVELRAGSDNGLPDLDEFQHEIPVHLEISGDMEAVQAFLFSLPLNDEELREINNELASDRRKSPFFINRFILKKASRENADEVSLEIVASGFLDLRTVR